MNSWTPLSPQHCCNTTDFAGLALQELDFEHQEACARHSPGQRNDRASSPKDDPDALHAQFARAQQVILLDAVRTRFPAPASPATAKSKGAEQTVTAGLRKQQGAPQHVLHQNCLLLDWVSSTSKILEPHAPWHRSSTRAHQT